MSKKPQPARSVPPPSALAVERSIYALRGRKVMLDADLAVLYGVPTKALNQAVQRNISRFPDDFMFQLTKEELHRFEVTICDLKRGNDLIYKDSNVEKDRRGGRRALPYAFTEQGIAMLSSILKSERAVQMNILIIRTFVKLREMLAANKELAARMEKLERTQARHGSVLGLLVEEIKAMKAPPPGSKRRIGFLP